MSVVITRLDVSAADLREAAARTQDAKASRRMLAIALVLDGWSREAAAEACAIEDSHTGIAAAKGAGMYAIQLLHEGMEPSPLADAVIRSAAEIYLGPVADQAV